MKTVKELHLLVGLPGSGKTTFAETYMDINGRYKYNPKIGLGDVIEFDIIYKNVGFVNGISINRKKIENMKLKTITKPYVIIDGLFLTQDEYEWVLGLFVKGEQYKNIVFEKIIIDYWVPDKESCIWNDRGRRDIPSVFSINILDVEYPDIKTIENKFGIKTNLKVHNIVKKPEYLIMAGENGVKEIRDNRYFLSASWSLGGVGRSWADESTYPISGEEPLEFDEFDALLEQICPNITFLQYKKLYKACVTTEEFDDSDYYQSCTSCRYVCDLKVLYDMLVEMGIYSLE